MTVHLRTVAGLSLVIAGMLVPTGSEPARAADLPLGPRSVKERRSTVAVAPGIKLTRIVRGGRARDRRRYGPWRLRVLTIDRRLVRGRLGAILSNERIAGRETVSAMARRRRARVGANGGFFVTSDRAEGDLVGAFALPGQLLSEPVDGRTALLIPRSSIAPVELTPLYFGGSLQVGGNQRLLDGVDRIRGVIPACGGNGGDEPTESPHAGLVCSDSSELVMLSPRFGSRTLTYPPGVEAVVREGVVTELRRGGNAPIPRDGFVLSGSGDAATFLRDFAPVGSIPEVRTQLHTGRRPIRLEDYEAIMSGAPLLLRRGRLRIRSRAEGFAHPGFEALFFSFVGYPNPRTLVGVRRDGRVMVVTVDGRQPSWSIGMTLNQAARVMRALGARAALNLDGGGSSAMTIGARVANRPSDGAERAVGDGIFVLP